MPADRTFWPLPPEPTPPQLYLWGQRLINMLRLGRHVETLSGSLTLSSGKLTTVADTNVLTGSVIALQPTNSAASTLGLPAVTAKTLATGFTLSHGTAAGTETYDYVLVR